MLSKAVKFPFVNRPFFRTVLALQKNWEDSTQSSLYPISPIINILNNYDYLLQQMNQHWYITTNWSPLFI